MKDYFVFLLRFQDGSYYTGVTNDLQRRIREHSSSLDPSSYVSRKGSFELVYNETFGDIWDAIRREKQIQSWSRKKKAALVKQDDDELHQFAKKNFL